MILKYLRYKGADGLEHVVVFDALINHRDMALRVCPEREVLSAGKVRLTLEGCEHGSVSLVLEKDANQAILDEEEIKKLGELL